MDIKIVRRYKGIYGIIGELYIHNTHKYYTLENKEKAIPAGKYRMWIQRSNKFNRDLIHLNVPRRTGIMIHPANHPEELRGCIALGYIADNETEKILNSRLACNDFFNLVKNYLDKIKKACYISIVEI